MQEVKFTFSDLSITDVNIIMAGLGKLPMEAVVDLWQRLKSQAEQQMSSSNAEDQTS